MKRSRKPSASTVPVRPERTGGSFLRGPNRYRKPSRKAVRDGFLYVNRFHFDPQVGTEELGHLEMIGAIVHQLTRKLTDAQMEESGFMPYFVDHSAGVYPTAASGSPWNAAGIGVKGDPIADLTEDLAAEQKARVTYDNILRLSDDPDVNDVIRFLREREIVHFQRFGEAIELLRQKLDQKNVYAMNPALDS